MSDSPGLLMVTEKREKSPSGIHANGLNACAGKSGVLECWGLGQDDEWRR